MRVRGVPLLVSALMTLAAVPGVSDAGSSYPKTVGRDAAGDWGQGSPAADAGSVSGEDLLRASIGPGETGVLEFILDVSEVPPAPPYTAFAVYEWYFEVDGVAFGFYGPCQGHVYRQCATATDPLAFVVVGPGGEEYMGVARLDEYEDIGQVIFPIPKAFLGADGGSVIAPLPASNNFTEDAVVAHTFYFVNNPSDDSNVTPRDFLTVKRNYRVP